MSNRGKIVTVVGLLLIAGLAGWEAWRTIGQPLPPAPTPLQPAAPSLPPVKQPPQPQLEKPIALPPPPKKAAPVRPKPSKAVKKAAVPRPLTPAAPIVPAPAPVIPALPPAPPPPEYQEWRGNDTAIRHSGQVVIRNDHQWIQFWAEHRPDEAAPDVDFTRDMVIGVFSGDRPADQFSIEILKTMTTPNALIVYYREIPPPTGTLAIGVSVYPYDVKVIPRSMLPVKFTLLAPQL
jgi:hypothetical protein